MARKSSSPHGRCHIGIDPDIFGAAKATAKIDEIKIILSRNMFEFIVVNFSQVLFADDDLIESVWKNDNDKALNDILDRREIVN